MVKTIDVGPRGRWEVVFREDDRWQAGVYVPEYTSASEIDVLERHDAPELFMLVSGRIVLVLSESPPETRELPMEPGKIYVVEEWHNAYRPNGEPGIALVIERTGIRTEYRRISRKLS